MKQKGLRTCNFLKILSSVILNFKFNMFLFSTTWNSPRWGWWLHPWPFGQGGQWPQCTTFRRFEELRLRRLWQHRRFSQLPSLGKRGKRTGLRLPQRMGTTLPEIGRHLWSRRQRRRLRRKKDYYLSPIHTSQKSGGRLKLKPNKILFKVLLPTPHQMICAHTRQII